MGETILQSFYLLLVLVGLVFIILSPILLIAFLIKLSSRKKYNQRNNVPPSVPQQHIQNKYNNTNIQKFQPQEPPIPTQAPVIQQYERQTPYQGKYVLTDHEKSFYYKALKPVADELGLIALCQVNLAAVIGIQYRVENYMSWFGKIKSKRLDFVLCNPDFFPVLVIELDDSSHDRPDRIERDQQVNLYLYEANIKILHFRAWTPEQVRQVIIETLKTPIAM